MSTYSSKSISYAAELIGSFNGRHMILFVGKDISNGEITDKLCKLPWSCVITTRQDDKFGAFFQNDERIIKDYTCDDIKKISARPLSKQGELTILRVMGIEGQENSIDQEDLEIQGLSLEDYRINEAEKILGLIPGLFDGANIMVVINYNPEIEGELPYPRFARILTNSNIHEGKVQFWGLNEESEIISSKLKKLSDKYGYVWRSESLVDIISLWDEADIVKADQDTDPYDGKYHFYKGGIVCNFPSEKVLKYKHLADIVTEQSVYAIRPYGRIQQARWYYNYLLLSSTEGPQWYGYLKSSEFYLRREFEDVLVNLVRKKLTGADPLNTNSPIILYGEPGTSKSVTLGALAFRVFNEHFYPVVYINNDTLSLASESSDFQGLVELMEDIEKIGKDMRILLIWDCSSYRSVAADAIRLSELLLNRGRKFVLVCSAYDDPNEKDDKRVFLNYSRSENNEVSFRKCDIEQSNLYYCNHCYYINAPRNLNENEQAKLWLKIREFSGASSDNIMQLKQRIGESDDIFNIFYSIIGFLRPKLEQALTKEEAKVRRYIDDQLTDICRITDQNTQQPNSIQQAFMNLGIDLSILDGNDSCDESPDEDSEGEFDQVRFNSFIALLSRFKIETPYSLAIQMLKPREQFLTDISIDYNPELFRILTTGIPWLRYGESKNGNDYSFSFRNPLEADLFLKRNGIEAAQQVQLLCDALDYYGRYYHENRYILDATLEKNLQSLTRLMGPNSQYPPFHTDKKTQHTNILLHLEEIIESLNRLLNDYGIPDDDAGFSTLLTTFTREYYGKTLWKRLHDENQDKDSFSENCYKLRIQKIHSIMSFALEKINNLETQIEDSSWDKEKKYLINQKNGLIVEIALCYTEFNRIIREYRERYSDTQSSIPFEKYPGLSYQVIYRQLYDVILYNPVNGHAYNALFKAFEEMYDHTQLSEEEKLQCLSEIRLVADESRSTELFSRGADDHNEIEYHWQKIEQYGANYQITIDDIHKKTVEPAFYALYTKMLNAKRPAAITFVCQQELEKVGITYKTEKITNEQLAVCKKVMDFMNEENNYMCISNDYYALCLLLKVTWIFYTGSIMRNSPECQLIKLSIDSWEVIRKLSERCISAAKKQTINRAKPIIVLIYALSTFHVTNDYYNCERILMGLDLDQFSSEGRMKVPFIVCDINGPILHNGRVKSIKGYSGKIVGINNDQEFRFRMRDIGRGTHPCTENERLGNLELGLGYMGFSVFTEEGRIARGDRR